MNVDLAVQQGQPQSSWVDGVQTIFTKIQTTKCVFLVRKYRELVRRAKQTRVEQIILSGILLVIGSRGQEYLLEIAGG